MVKPFEVAELRDLPIDELKGRGFLYRHKTIVFGGGPAPSTPPRRKDIKDGEYKADIFDYLFSSHDEFKTWNKRVTAGLAELDQCLNYCQYFERIKGNTGFYSRDGHRFPVDGQWCGLHDFHSTYTAAFEAWLAEHGWTDNWFELHDRYKAAHCSL